MTVLLAGPPSEVKMLFLPPRAPSTAESETAALTACSTAEKSRTPFWLKFPKR